MSRRTETDSLGSIEIDADRYWGPQTERARLLFQIGTERFPANLIRAVGLQKQAAAEANLQLGELPREIAEPIIAAAKARTTASLSFIVAPQMLIYPFARDEANKAVLNEC